MNDDTNTIYALLNNAPGFGDQQKRLLVARYDRNEEVPSAIAYDIAGLMSVRVIFEAKLPDNDPFDQVLTLAGVLELPDGHHAPGETWSRLKDLVSRLP